jgi:uncharacterized membrane protein
MAPRKSPPPRLEGESLLEYAAFRATRGVGSIASVIIHTVGFIVSFVLYFMGVPFNTILLVLTTVVSLEAIYLSIFIQMSVNRQTKQLREVSKDVEQIHENVEDIQEDVEEIQGDIDEIQEDVEDIQEEDATEESEEEKAEKEVLGRIEHSLKELGHEIAEMKRRGHSSPSSKFLGQ